MGKENQNILGTLMRLKNEVDFETIGLLIRFCERAFNSGDPAQFLNRALKAVVNAPEPDPGQEARTVQVEVMRSRQ